MVLENIKKKLEEFIEEDNCNRRIACMSSYVFAKEKEENIYPFCKKPLDFIFTNNVKDEFSDPDKFSNNFFNFCKKIETVWEPSARVTRGGFQSLDNLFEHNDNQEINELKNVIYKKIEFYKEKFLSCSDLFIRKWPNEASIRAWYVKLQNQGYQKAHIHPSAWLSGVFYLKIPNSLQNNEGSIMLELYGYDYPKDEKLDFKIHSPKNFDIILFPSSLFHRTIPFSSNEGRYVIPFDLNPKNT